MLVQDLRGPLLSYWVAKAEGLSVRMSGSHAWVGINLAPYAPHHNCDTSMQLLTKHNLSLVSYIRRVDMKRLWTATWEEFEEWIDDSLPFHTRTRGDYCGLLHGDTAQEAICRAVVAMTFGGEVPDEVQP